MKTPASIGSLRCFTLIELLVVISIIALLISISLPTLRHTKRQVKVLTCTTNLKSIGLGMHAYVTENNGVYPTPSCINGNWVKAAVDNRQNLVDMAGGIPEFWFCPLFSYQRPSTNLAVYNDPNIPFAKHFIDPNQVPSTGYFLSFIVIDGKFHTGLGGGLQWDWSHSGNPDGPWFPGDSSAIAVMDNNGIEAPLSGDNWKKPDWSAHSRDLPFQESNSLWGDGHAETRTTVQNYVNRLGPPSVTVY